MNLLKILSNIQGWFVHFKVYINSPTIIYNMAKAIELSDSKPTKIRVERYNRHCKLNEAFHKLLKDKGIS